MQEQREEEKYTIYDDGQDRAVVGVLEQLAGVADCAMFSLIQGLFCGRVIGSIAGGNAAVAMGALPFLLSALFKSAELHARIVRGRPPNFFETISYIPQTPNLALVFLVGVTAGMHSSGAQVTLFSWAEMPTMRL